MARSRSKPPKVLVLCHGNIYRSPIAAAALRAAGIQEVRSAGFARAGRRAARRARLAASALGYDLEQHRSALVDAEGLGWADLVVYMDSGNRKRLEDFMSLHGVIRPYVCLGRFCLPQRPRIRDPAFVGDRVEFLRLICDIDAASRRLAGALSVWGPGLPPSRWGPP